MNELDANMEALKRHEADEDRYEKIVNEFRDSMNDAIAHLIKEFNHHARFSMINRIELRNILLEDIGEML